MKLSVQGKTAIVTGAGRGVGLAIAKNLVERGANVMFADTDELLAESEPARDYGADDPVRVFACDVSEKLAAANLLSATIDAFDRIDLLVNAHRLVRHGDPMKTDAEALDLMLKHNLTASLRLSQMVANRMIKQAATEPDQTEAGAIINLTTLAGSRPVPAMLEYSIACAAVEQATRGLALALAPHRIRVNGVSFASIMSHELKCSLKENPDLRDAVIEGTPLGRIAGADELTDTVFYLASAGAGFVTGQILTVDGGRSLADLVTARAM